jgi:hypothetical protein
VGEAVIVMAGNLPATAPRHGHPGAARVAVDVWYVGCVLVPLLACVTSPAWFLLLVDAHPRTVVAAFGVLAAGWVPWLMALLGMVALADRYELERHPRGRTEADAWDAFSVHLLAVTGGVGVIVTLLLTGVLLSVALP